MSEHGTWARPSKNDLIDAAHRAHELKREAADDMYEALVDLMRLYCGLAHPQENTVPSWDRARAALAKAEGRTD